jgi:hypothetical protein
MEPEWMKQISSESVCNFFYVFFVVYAVLFGLSLVTTIGTLFNMKKMGTAGLFMAIQAVLITAIPGIMMMFYYIICNRALLANQAETSGKVNQVMA